MKHIPKPTIVQAAGCPPKQIEEFIGRIASQTSEVSIAKMISPAGWSEPGQIAEFNEYTIVLRGTLKAKLKEEEIDISAGQALLIEAGEWVQYSTPKGAEYVAVCLPAFSSEIEMLRS